eukprot:264174_1
MNDQTKAPTGPELCKMGCGFFGSGASGGCCSKCWRENQKKAETEAAAAVQDAPREEPMKIDPPVPEPESLPTESAKPAPAPAPVPVETTSMEAPKKKKKKSKKANYKNLMAGMVKSSPTRDVEKEKEQLRKVTGGGAFSKIDKI